MASDDFNWDDDPFGGDLDFNDDFDSPNKKKGFLRSLATGFLGGLVENSIGSTDARIKSLQMVMPKTYGGAFNNLSILNNQRKEIIEELKNESVDTVKDLQYFAKRAADRLGKDSSNRISGGLISFSTKDFSDWEKPKSGGSTDAGMEGVEDEDVTSFISSEDANSILERETAEGVGARTIGMMSQVGGRSIAGINTLNKSILKNNQLLEQLVDHQRRVKSKNDALQLNVLARTYLTNVKFYKFMESANHRVISELKDLVKFGKMSDYEKTSTSQAVRKNLRESFFNTARGKVGGVASFITDRFGKSARSSAMSGISDLTSSARMGLEMSEGMPMNVGDMVGNALSQIFLSQLPAMVGSEKGKAWLEEKSRQHPKFAKWFKEKYKEAEDFGNVATYATGNAEELANSMALHYKNDSTFGFEEEETYEGYLENLPEGKDKLSKFQWGVLNKTKGLATKGISHFLDSTQVSKGTSYQIKGRTLSDSYEQTLWSNRSDRTLNEEIPRWLSEIHLSLEKSRTGDEKLKANSYDYVKANFITSSEKNKHVLDTVLDKSSFSRQADTAKSMVGNIDKDKALSPKAENELAFQLAKQADRGLGFNPYNLIKLETQGIGSDIASEIRNVIKGQFGITDEDISRFDEGDDINRLKMMTSLPTKEAREKVVGLSESAKGLSSMAPDISRDLDTLKGTGYYDALKESGLIQTDQYGREGVNHELLDDTLKGYIGNKDYHPLTPPSTPPSTFRSQMGKRTRVVEEPLELPPQETQQHDPDTVSVNLEGLSELAPSLKEFSVMMRGLSEVGFDLTPMVSESKDINNKLNVLIESASARNDLLNSILVRQPKEKLFAGKKATEQDAKEGDKQKKGIMERLKTSSLKDTFNKGVGKLLEQEPLMLGGLLGGLAGVAAFNPKAGALLAGGAAVALAYGKINALSKAKTATDTEDLYEEGSTTPILEAWKLKNNDYYDMASNAIVTSWSAIKGSVKDISTGVIIGAKRLAGKLFTAENKEVFLDGLSKVRKLLVSTFNALDPFGRISKMTNKVATRFYQMDVYKEGDKEPTLLGTRFKTNSYFKKNKEGVAEPIKGWNEIDGPVYDQDGNVLITQEEFDRGLITSMGVSVNKLGSFAKTVKDATGGLLGKLKDKTLGAGKTVGKEIKDTLKNDYTPVVSSVDRIFNLLVKKWGLDPNEFKTKEGELPDSLLVINTVGETNTNTLEPNVNDIASLPKAKDDTLTVSPTITDPSGRGNKLQDSSNQRLNSIDDMLRKEALEKDELVKDSIINMGSGLGGEGDNDKEKKEGGKGIFGLLSSGFNSIKTFGASLLGFVTGPMWGVLSTLGSFALSGIKLLPVIASGIWSLAKGAGKVAGNVFDSIAGRGGKGKFKGGGKMLAGAALGAAAYGLTKTGIIEEGGVIESGMNLAGTGLGIYGTAQLLAPGLTAAASGAVATGVSATAGAAVAGGTAAWGLMAPLLFNPVTLGILAVGLAGYGVYKFMKRGAGKQIELRLAQYGVGDKDSKLAEKIFRMEGLLKDHVVVSNARASFSKDAPVAEALKVLVGNSEDQDEMRRVFVWFNNRFKPVFLTYMATISTLPVKTLEAYDESNKMIIYEAAKQIHDTLGSITPHPYSIVTKIDPDTELFDDKRTTARVVNLLKELKTYVERKNKGKDKEKIDLLVAPIAIEEERKQLKDTIEEDSGLWNNTFNPFSSIGKASKRLDELEKEAKVLNSIYKVGGKLADIDITDMLKPGESLDLFTAVRVSAYGNSENIPWRVEAVLKLERYCESLFRINGGEVTFIGEIGTLYGVFKEAFRSPKGKEGNWCLWFRDRFLPVMTEYIRSMQTYRVGKPATVWRTLSATAKYEIARNLLEVKTEITDGKFVPIWDAKIGPFDKGFSESDNTKATNMVRALSEASEVARLKDPKTEEISTRRQSLEDEEFSVVNEDSSVTSVSQTTKGDIGSYSNSTLGGFAGDVKQRQNEASSMGSGGMPAWSTKGFDGKTDAGNTAATNTAQQVYSPMMGVGDNAGDLTTTGVIRNKGNDRGVKTPKRLAEKLLIREMLAQGFTDPREIAMVLAQTRMESGEFAHSVENMNYTKPATLVKLFREVRSIDQARALSAAGPVAIANTVYGGGKGRELGNFRPGDGWDLRGRGWMQTTGGHNYKATGDRLGYDFLNNPKLLSEDPGVMAKSAVDYFKHNKMMRSISSGQPFSYAGKGINPSGPPEMGRREQYYKDYLALITSGKLTADGEEFENEVKMAEEGGGEANAVADTGTIETPDGGTLPASSEAGKEAGNIIAKEDTDEFKVDSSFGAPPPPPPTTVKPEVTLNTDITKAPAPPPPVELSDYTPSKQVSNVAVVSTPTPIKEPVSTPTPSAIKETSVASMTSPVRSRQDEVAKTPTPILQQVQQDLSGLTEGISSAVLTSGNQQNILLQNVVAQLAKLNESMAKTPETVRLG